ncbi:MAG: putative Ig domain-containing protein, partial [Bacteroidales bacterium]|nr:putative Ig domain-containing protein [Bacteroidales bacterium]
MKLLYTFCLSSAIVLAAACGRTGDAVSENLPDVFPNVLEGGINPNVREVCDDTLKTHILTPPAPAEPRIHGPKVYGERPGRPFQYRIPATGERPMTFSAEGLPHGLKLDASSGIITGKVRRKGTWNATLKAENAKGSDTRPLKIVIGDEIALTPPLGWNSWNCYASGVDQNKIAAAAKAMVDKGLADYGWTYVNIDDAWQGIRGGKYNAIQGNKKFPDMDGLSRYVHAKGLKLGIYSSPWTITYAGHIGSSADNADGTYERIKAGICNDLYRVTRYMNEADSLKFETPERVWRFFGHSFVKNDAAQWADWGIDYLKYDWGPMDPVSAKEMADALIESGRDVVFSISNSAFLGNGPLWKEFVNCWRSTGDIANTWESVSHIGFNLQERWAPYVRPGHWADADMLEVGNG